MNELSTFQLIVLAFTVVSVIYVLYFIINAIYTQLYDGLNGLYCNDNAKAKANKQSKYK